MNKKIICPVCGVVNAVKETPWHYEDNEFVASQDICPCCGTHYGEDDWAENEKEVGIMHIMLRKKWIADGMKWWSKDDKYHPQPQDWNPKKQLENISTEFK